MSASFQKPRTKGKSGYYYGIAYDPTRRPKRKWVALRTQNATVARQRWAQLEKRNALGKYDPWNDKVRFEAARLSEAIDEYVASVEGEQAERTVKQKEYVLKYFNRAVGAAVPVNAIRAEDVEGFLDGIEGKEKGSEPSAHTLRRYYSTLSAFFRWCKGEGHVRSLPTADYSPPPQPESKRMVLRPHQIEALKTQIREDHAGNYRMQRLFMLPFLDFMAATGLRTGEMCAINARDLELTGGHGYVHVRAYTDPRTGRTWKPKHRRDRIVPLYPRAARAARAALEGRDPHPYDPLFPPPRAERAKVRTISRIFVATRKKALPGYEAACYDLRHTFISWLLNDLGRPISTVSKIAGHANLETTQQYVHVGHEDIMGTIDASLRAVGLRDGEPPSRAVAVGKWLDGRTGTPPVGLEGLEAEATRGGSADGEGAAGGEADYMRKR